MNADSCRRVALLPTAHVHRQFTHTPQNRLVQAQRFAISSGHELAPQVDLEIPDADVAAGIDRS